MQEGQVRPLDGDVVVRMEVRSQERQVTVTREALADFLQLSCAEAAQLTIDQRCDRVRKNLPSVAAAVQRKIDNGDPSAASVVIFAGEM